MTVLWFLKFEVLYWLVTGLTAFFSFSLPGLLLAAIGNVYVRDYFSFIRGVAVLWFIASAVPLFGEPGSLEKIVGTLGILAALVIFFYTFTRSPRPENRHRPVLVVVYSALVLAVSLYMIWTGEATLVGAFWIPAIIFLLLCVYSFLFQANTSSQ